MLELCHELRFPFINCVVSNQKSSFKRFEISYVYRRLIGHSPPNQYLQGDFDVIGGASTFKEAEVIKEIVWLLRHNMQKNYRLMARIVETKDDIEKKDDNVCAHDTRLMMLQLSVDHNTSVEEVR